MINKIKNLFLLALCVAAFGAMHCVSAQTGGNEVLVPGKQPLRQADVNRVIEFYEWAFETVFSPDEFERFQAISIEAYRQDAATSRKNADALISAIAKVRAKTPAEQSETRRAFNDAFVKDLRAGNDEASQLLLGIYERAQNDGGNRKGKGSGSGNGDDDATIVEVLPSEEDLRDAEKSTPSSGGAGSQKLAGRWEKSGGAGGNDDGTGKTRYNSGNDVIFEFFADGAMRFINDKNTLSITQCRITEITKIPGRYSTSGDTLTMNLGAGTVVGTNSCDAKGNFKKNLTADTLVKKFVVKRLDSVFRPDAPLILCLDGQKDDECYERASK